MTPLQAATYVPGQTILLQGMAADSGSLLPSANLSWTSNLSGALGSGSPVKVDAAALQKGIHTVTLTAHDAGGRTGTAKLILLVANAGCPAITLSPTSLSSGTVSTFYSGSVTASGGTSPYTYTLAAGTLPAGVTFSNGALSGTPTQDGTFSITVVATNNAGCLGGQAYTLEVKAQSGCTTGGPNLCINQNRFKLAVSWKNPYDGVSTGVGTAVSLTSDSGYFWFFNSTNIELVIKILDGRTVNGKFWVLYGALSDVEYTITITDTQTGFVKTMFNPGRNLASVADITALPGSRPRPDHGELAFIPADYGQLASLQLANGGSEERKAALAKPAAVVEPAPDASRNPLATCAAAGDTLCLNASRFQLRATWKNYNDGSTGSGVAVKLTDDSGYYWFFDSANVEPVLKVLDGRSTNGKFWVFYGALSDVEYTINVKDTSTGIEKNYHNPPHTLESIADTGVF